MPRSAKRPKGTTTPMPASGRPLRRRAGSRVRDFETRLAEAPQREAEAVEQQTASREVLKSSADLTPVLQTLVENASRLSAAATGMMRKLDGPVFGLWPNVMTECAQPAELKEFDQHHPRPVERGTATGRPGLERRTVHLHDVSG